MDWDSIAKQIATATDIDIRPATAGRVAGGSINEAWAVDSNKGRLFVKFNDAALHEMFVAEAEGLAELAASNTVRVPAVVMTAVTGNKAFLVLEFVDLVRGGAAAERHLGAELAAMHGCGAQRFGWHRDNTIGSTPQINTPATDWLQFFDRHRLGYQLELAAERGAPRLIDSGQQLRQRMGVFFSGVSFEPRLLHGDLWGGNWAVARGGQPVIFDPAVYYGDPETDIAMSELFGGFGDDFYAAYRDHMPDVAGAAQRRDLYRVYHVLNHYNLFGGNYRRQAEQLIGRLLAQT